MEQEIFLKVQDTLAGALAVNAKEIHLDASLTRDLGAESIDFIDIIFRLEKTFNLKIPTGELFPGNILNDERFVKEGKVTPEGLVELKARMPYMDLDAFARDPQVSKLAEYFTVRMIVAYLEDRLAKSAKA